MLLCQKEESRTFEVRTSRFRTFREASVDLTSRPPPHPILSFFKSQILQARLSVRANPSPWYPILQCQTASLASRSLSARSLLILKAMLTPSILLQIYENPLQSQFRSSHFLDVQYPFPIPGVEAGSISILASSLPPSASGFLHYPLLPSLLHPLFSSPSTFSHPSLRRGV